MRKKICVITGTRAEYGLLQGLMDKIREDKDLILQVVATGAHLSPEFGRTYRQIEDDGFVIDEKLEMLLSSDTSVGIAKSVGLATIGFADIWERLKPDVIVLLGDRYEILAAAQAALIARIPIAHLHGGEVTEGAIDESIRHAITKMAHLHFAAAEPYRKRIIQLGEHPERVYNVGAPGLDNIKKLNLLDEQQFEESTGFRLSELNFLVTYHPVTATKQDNEISILNLLEALDDFPDARIIFTKANADADGRIINHWIDRYVAKNANRTIAFDSLGQVRYLSAIKHVQVVIGNSSSGIIEVPLFKKPTVNIGDRQKGRLKAASVIDCSEDREEISQAIKKALSPDFRKHLNDVESLYGIGDTAEKIIAVLKTADIDGLLQKGFYDLAK